MMQDILGVALIAVGLISLIAHIVETGRRAAAVGAETRPAPSKSAPRQRSRRTRQRRRTGPLPRA